MKIMKNEEVKATYGFGKGLGIGIGFQILLLVLALVLTAFGIKGALHDVCRLIVYIGQAATCILFILFGLLRFKKHSDSAFKRIIYSYAFLEALRAALLNTSGVDDFPAIIARFLLVALACNCVLFAERCEKKESLAVSYGLLAFEILVYIVFLLGFPGVMYGHLNRFLPFVGVLIAGTLILFQKARLSYKAAESTAE